MKKIRMFLLVAILLCSSKVFADGFIKDGIAYTITSTEEPYTVAVASGGTYTGSITIPSTVTPSDKTYSVTSIGDGAFYGSDKMTELTLPSSITAIGTDAFGWCTLLTTIYSNITAPFSTNGFSTIPNRANVILVIPDGTTEAYKNATGWSGFKLLAEKSADILTLTSAGYATYCSVKNLDFSADDGLDAYLATAYSSTTGTLTVTKYDKIPAGSGMLLKGEAGDYAVNKTDEAPTVANLLVGTTSGLTLDQTSSEGAITNFVLDKKDDVVSFYKVDASGCTLAANKAYLPLPTNNISSSSKKLVVNFKNENGQTTDIKTVELNGNLENIIYNLQGQKVENPEHGIYIVKGKKTYIK